MVVEVGGVAAKRQRGGCMDLLGEEKGGVCAGRLCGGPATAHCASFIHENHTSDTTYAQRSTCIADEYACGSSLQDFLNANYFFFRSLFFYILVGTSSNQDVQKFILFVVVFVVGGGSPG